MVGPDGRAHVENQREWRVGAHVLCLEPPDIVWADLQGRVSLEEAIRLVDFYRERSRSGPFFLLVDVTDVPRMEAETQRYLSEHADPAWLLANIIIGARLAHKAAAKGVFLAAWLTGRAEKSEIAKVHFASTRAEAAALVTRLRGSRGSDPTSPAG
jgi:hypothetical protein